MANPRRVSDPPVSTSTYPASLSARASRSSSIFPYSLGRPPTNYSQQSWVNPEAPPVPDEHTRGHLRPPESPFDGIAEEDEEQLEAETPLYARSDWDESIRSPIDTDASAYSRSSFAGLTTAPPTTAPRTNTLGDIREEDEYILGEDEDGRGGWGFGGGQMMSSPGAMTATPRTATSGQQRGQWATDGLTMSPGAITSSPYTGQAQEYGRAAQAQWAENGLTSSPGAISATPRKAVFGQTDLTTSPGGITPATQDRSKYESLRRSTLPSVLELEHLTRSKQDPFPDPGGASLRGGYGQATPVHTVGQSPGADSSSPRSARSPRLLSPAAHEKLGRMSVATARYSEATGRHKKKHLAFKETEGGSNLAELPVKGVSGLRRFYLTWRPFIVATLTLVSALLLTISLQNNPGPVSRYIIVPADAFVKSPSNIGQVGLGVNGWCPLDGSVATLTELHAEAWMWLISRQECQVYRSGDFANADAQYTLPGE